MPSSNQMDDAKLTWNRLQPFQITYMSMQKLFQEDEMGKAQKLQSELIQIQPNPIKIIRNELNPRNLLMFS